MKKAPKPSKVKGAFSVQLSFLPTPVFCPKWPKPTTVAGRVLAELLRGEFLDHEDLIAGCSSWRMAAYVFELKSMGWPIAKFDKAAPSAGCPGRVIALYGLSPEIISQAQSLRGAA